MHLKWVLLSCLAAVSAGQKKCSSPKPKPKPKPKPEASLPDIWKPGVKWQIILHAPVDISQPLIPADARVWDIDYFSAIDDEEIIPTLKNPAKGVENVVLCYINIGAIEEYEYDFEEFPKDAMGKGYTDYPEWWIDVRREDVVEFMKRRFVKAAELGCDGIDPDNIDGYDWDEKGVDKTGFNLTQTDLITYVTTLADFAHNNLTTKRGLPLMFGQKNANHIASKLVNIVDFAVLEDCQGWYRREAGVHEPYCHDFQAFVTGANRTDGKMLPVFELEYPVSTENSSTALSSEDWDYYCNRSKVEVGNVDFSLVIKHESAQLDGWGQYCEGNETLGKCMTFTVPDEYPSDDTDDIA